MATNPASTWNDAYGISGPSISPTSTDPIQDILEDVQSINKTFTVEQNEDDAKRKQFVDTRTMVVNAVLFVLTAIPMFFITTDVQFFFTCFVFIAIIIFLNNISMYWTSKQMRLNQTLNPINSQIILDDFHWVILFVTLIFLNIIRDRFSKFGHVNPLYLILLPILFLGISTIINHLSETAELKIR
jgi:hypothetical protein